MNPNKLKESYVPIPISKNNHGKSTADKPDCNQPNKKHSNHTNMDAQRVLFDIALRVIKRMKTLGNK